MTIGGSKGGQSWRWSDHWRGHVFLFEGAPAPTYSASAGLRLLLIVLLLEGVLGPRLWIASLLSIPIPPVWIRVPLLLGCALLAVRFVAGVWLSRIGFRPWRVWTRTETSYLVQVVLIANVVFCLLFADRLRALFAESSAWSSASVALLTSFLWGFHQELMYRGILQTELVRRWGSVPGILVANLLYTFGPLHFYHVSVGSRALPMFAGIFAIGLLFAVVFRRSGNLWIVAVMHGIGNLYIIGTLPP